MGVRKLRLSEACDCPGPRPCCWRAGSGVHVFHLQLLPSHHTAFWDTSVLGPMLPLGEERLLHPVIRLGTW